MFFAKFYTDARTARLFNQSRFVDGATFIDCFMDTEHITFSPDGNLERAIYHGSYSSCPPWGCTPVHAGNIYMDASSIVIAATDEQIEPYKDEEDFEGLLREWVANMEERRPEVHTAEEVSGLRCSTVNNVVDWDEFFKDA